MPPTANPIPVQPNRSCGRAPVVKLDGMEHRIPSRWLVLVTMDDDDEEKDGM